MAQELKLKNVANPIELLSTLKALVTDLLDNSEVIDRIKDVHETLTGTQYIKVFNDMDDCVLESGSSNLAGGYLFC